MLFGTEKNSFSAIFSAFCSRQKMLKLESTKDPEMEKIQQQKYVALFNQLRSLNYNKQKGKNS